MAVRLHKKYQEDENRFHQVSPFEDRKSYLRLGVTRYFSHYFKAISTILRLFPIWKKEMIYISQQTRYRIDKSSKNNTSNHTTYH